MRLQHTDGLQSGLRVLVAAAPLLSDLLLAQQDHGVAQILEGLDCLRLGHDVQNGGLQQVNNGLIGAGGSREGVPGAAVGGQVVVSGAGQVAGEVRGLGAVAEQGDEVAGLDVSGDLRPDGSGSVHVAAQQVGDSLSAAAVGDVLEQVGIIGQTQAQSRQTDVVGGAGAGGAVGDGAGIGLGLLHQLIEGGDAGILADADEGRRRGDLADGGEALIGVGHVVQPRGQRTGTAGGEDQGVAVVLGGGQQLHTDGAGSAGLVVDHNGDAQTLGQLIGHRAAHQVAAAAGGVGADDGDGLLGPIQLGLLLGVAVAFGVGIGGLVAAGHQRQGHREGEDKTKDSLHLFHVRSPCMKHIITSIININFKIYRYRANINT